MGEGYWVKGIGSRVLGQGHGVMGIGSWALGQGHWVMGIGSRVEGLGPAAGLLLFKQDPNTERISKPWEINSKGYPNKEKNMLIKYMLSNGFEPMTIFLKSLICIYYNIP